MYSVELYVKIRRAVMVEGKSEREVARFFGVHRKTVKKMCRYAVPPGYRRKSEPVSPKLAEVRIESHRKANLPASGPAGRSPSGGDWRHARRMSMELSEAGATINL